MMYKLGSENRNATDAIVPKKSDTPAIISEKIGKWEKILYQKCWQDLAEDAARMNTVDYYCLFNNNTEFKMSPHLSRKFPPLSSGERRAFKLRTRSLVTLRDAYNWGISGTWAYQRLWPNSKFCKLCQTQDYRKEEDHRHMIFDCSGYNGIRNNLLARMHAIILVKQISGIIPPTTSAKDLITLAVSAGMKPLRIATKINRTSGSVDIRQQFMEAGTSYLDQIVLLRFLTLWPIHGRLESNGET
jgi:hypothetical protein